MTTKNETRDIYSASMEDPAFRSQFEREWYVEEFLVRIEEQMTSLGMTRKALAERLGCTPANVTQLFRRENNLTAESMVDLAGAVGLRLRHHFEPAASDVPWLPVHECDPWTTADGARLIRFPLRKTGGGGVSAKSIAFPECEPANDPADAPAVQAK